MNSFPQRLMPIPNFCERYGCSRTTAYREAAAGRLRLTKMGAATRVHEDDAEAWAALLRAESPAATPTSPQAA